MIKNENILCVTNTTWEGPFTKSTVQLMSRLASDNKVLFVEYPFTIKDVVLSLLGKSDRPVLRILGLNARLQTKNTSIGTTAYTWVVPPTLPSDYFQNKRISALINRINISIYSRSVKKALRLLDMKNIITINAYNPIYGIDLIGKFDERANIYYCFDGFGKHWKNKIIADEIFSKKVDAVIVTSEYLRQQKALLNSRIITVKNGVDFNIFNKAAKSAPLSLASKRIGYIGSIDQRFDIEKVEYAVQKLPDYLFEFTGDIRNKEVVNRLSKYANVTFNPPVPPENVPNLLCKCDVGIIPYIANEINKNVYPLKINEYLAVGTPVVMTNFAELPEFGDFVTFASTNDEFLQGIVKEIVSDSEEKVKSRNQFARNNSWEIRTKQFSNYVENILSTNPNANQ